MKTFRKNFGSGLITCLCLIFYSVPGLQLLAQNPPIIEFEYFFDVDPGEGNGINVPVSAGTNIDISFDIDLTGLPVGTHKVFFRTKDNNNKWSLTSANDIFVFKSHLIQAAPDIVYAEYFIDNDPGKGNGINIPLSQDPIVIVDFNIDLTSQTPGFHKAYFRTKDQNDHWSLTNVTDIYVEKHSVIQSLPEIVYAEYFIDTDPGPGKGINIPVIADSITDVDFEMDLSVLPAGLHNAFFRIKDEKGHWSLTNITDLEVKSVAPPENFNAVLQGEDKVYCSWDSIDNEELAGYRVYRNAQDISGLIDETEYLDTLLSSGALVYYVKAEYAVGISDPSDSVSIFPTGINHNSINGIKIYPNPFTDRTTIEFTNPDQSNYSLLLFSLTGNKVLEIENIKANRVEIERNNLPAGVYFVQLKGETRFGTIMIVIE